MSGNKTNQGGFLALTMYTDNREDWVQVINPDTGKKMRVRAIRRSDTHSNQVVLLFEAKREDYEVVRENAKTIKETIKNNAGLVASALSKGLKYD